MKPEKRKISVFSSEQVKPQEKSELLIQLLSAFREGTAKAVGAGANITYAKALKIIGKVNPELHRDILDFSKRGRPESREVKEFYEKAESRDKDPIELIKEEIRIVEQDISNGRKRQSQRGGLSPTFAILNNRLTKLNEALEYLILEKEISEFVESLLQDGTYVAEGEEKYETKLVEQQALIRDAHLAKRDENIYKSKEIVSDDCVEFSLTNNRLMRIRLWHNIKPESMTGVDLVYEQINIETKKMRFIHLQYKMWDDQKFHLTVRDTRQMERMQGKFCSGGYCTKRRKGELPYRMPFCSVFYRPTSKRQSKNAQLMTSGIHLPVCQIAALCSIKATIPKDIIYEQGLSNSTFDELFRNALIGSAWMDIKKVEKFYKDNDVLSSKDSMVLNIREEYGHGRDKIKSVEKLRDLLS